MTSHPDYPALEARLDFVHGRMLELQARVAGLEAQLYGRPAWAPIHPVSTAIRPPTPAPAPTPTHASAGEPLASATLRAPIPDDRASDGPVRVLAIAGGGALLLGLVFFVGYAIEQNWLAPGLRFMLAAIASALLTLAAWPIARRGYDAVAGAIGGAGLGGWFAAWLVARHAHELVSAPQTFAALAVGAAACLLIADRLRLRLMAGLATVAACATPVLVASGGGRLHELMIYQLLVIVGLVILDARRRWPELPTIALLATWLLAGSWAEHHLQQANGPAFMAWAAVLLLVSAGSAWRLITADSEHGERGHVYLRLLIAGVSTWAAALAAFGLGSPAFAAATALLSVWHLGLAVFLDRREHQASELFCGLGWVQALVLGPVGLEHVVVGWWLAMSVAATLIPWSGIKRLRGAMLVIPALAAVGWSVAGDEPWSLATGLLGAAVMLAASLWPYPHATHERPIPWLAIVGTLAWALVVVVDGPTPIVARLTWGLVPITALLAWACARPTRQAQLVASTQFGLGLLAVLAAVVDVDALVLGKAGLAGERLGIAVLVLVLAGFAAAIVARIRSAAELDEQPGERARATGLGLMIAGAVGLALLLGVALCCAGSVALGQVGYSLGIAGVGLGLIVAGLRLADGTWRQVGLAAIAVAAAKVVLVDLASAAVGWRALSFVGLGAILIAGAFAYSRAYRRACQTH